MFPIYLQKTGIPEGYDPAHFEREFPAICESHLNDGRALAFAFILYDFEQPEIRKVLADPIYWEALNQTSGKYLTIFSFHLTPKRGNSKSASPINEVFGYSNRFLEKKFGIELPNSQPLLLFFQVKDGRFSEPYIYELAVDSVESAFNEIRAAIVSAVESVKGVRPEFRGNTEEIFTLIKSALGQRKLLRRIGRAVNVADRIKGLFG